MLKVLYAENEIDTKEYVILKRVMPARCKESEGFKSKQVRTAFLLGRYMTICDLDCKEDDIYYNSYGKPFCKGKDFFNVSHTKDYIVYVRSNDRIGIDIEKVDNRLLEIIDYAYAKDEIEYIRSTNNFDEIIYRATLLWTIKESVFKASGVEKGLEPREIEAYDRDEIIFMGERYCIRHIDFRGNIITTASKIEYNELQLVEFRI